MSFFSFELIIIIAIVYLIIGSYSDIKTLEVPDLVSYSLIAIGFTLNIILSIYYKTSYYIIKSVLGFVLAFIIGLLFYYSGQWGGGDSKVLFGLGALIGLNYPNLNQINILNLTTFFNLIIETYFNDFFVKFLINMLFLGAIYGIIWIVFLSIRNLKETYKDFKEVLKDKKIKYLRYFSGLITIITLYLINFSPIEIFEIIDKKTKFVFSILLIMFYFLNYLFAFVKSVEKTAMIKNIEPEKLTEGDWIVEDIKIDGKYITGPKELGITEEQIKQLIKLKKQGKIDKIKVKYGIPFIPSFLFSIIYTYLFNRFLIF